jgi:hypothetical protein
MQHEARQIGAIENIEQTPFPESRHKMFGPAQNTDFTAPEAGPLLFQDFPADGYAVPFDMRIRFQVHVPADGNSIPCDASAAVNRDRAPDGDRVLHDPTLFNRYITPNAHHILAREVIIPAL